MKLLSSVALFLIIGYQFAFGQNRKLTDDDINKSSAVKMVFADTVRDCDEMDEWVRTDIKNKTVFLFLQGGIAPKAYTTDNAFENKYNIYFFDFGCTAPDPKCAIRYNEKVFEYLTGAYGKKWMKEIRKDIMGLAQWKAKK